VVGVLAAGVAELRHLQTPGGRLLVLRRRIVPVLTCRTLQCDDLAHWFYFLSSLASHLGWQAAYPENRNSRLLLTRRDAGLRAPATLFLNFASGNPSGQAHALPLPLSTKRAEWERAASLTSQEHIANRNSKANEEKSN